jgi:hypothetical protein
MLISLGFYLDPVNGDHTIGTYDCTIVTSGTVPWIFHIGKMIAFSVNFPFHTEYAGRTCLYTELTAFATLNIHYNRTSLLRNMRYILLLKIS